MRDSRRIRESGEEADQLKPHRMIKLNEKFALISLPKANLDDSFTDLVLPGGLRVTRSLPLPIEEHWQRWIGEIDTEELQEAGCYLLMTYPSASPAILDAENQNLMRRVSRYLDALLIVNTPYCAVNPILLTGANDSGNIRIRQKSDLDRPLRRDYNEESKRQVLTKEDFEQAAVIADSLSGVEGKQGYARLRRATSAFLAAIHESRQEERLHQFCRCIDGIVLSGKGSGKRDFKTRTALFIGTGHEALMEEIYEMRSAVEHLRPAESEAVNCHDLRSQRVRIIERTAQAELIARHCLNRILVNANLLQNFEDDARIGQFWAKEECDRRTAWGKPLCFKTDLAGTVQAKWITDDELGIPVRHHNDDSI